MPLVLTTIQNELTKFMDNQSPAFVGYPSSVSDVANAWADAVDTYASVVVPISTTSSAARTAFYSTMLGMNTTAMNGFAVIKAAFMAYATALAGGMTGAGFVGTPPPTLIPIETIVPLGMSGIPNSVIVSTLAGIIDVWFRTGLAVQISSGVTINWN